MVFRLHETLMFLSNVFCVIWLSVAPRSPPDHHGSRPMEPSQAISRPSAARLGSAGSPRLGSAQLGSPRLGSSRLGPARPGPARLGSARPGPARLGSPNFLPIVRAGNINRTVSYISRGLRPTPPPRCVVAVVVRVVVVVG
jgi:hypothetical protein